MQQHRIVSLTDPVAAQFETHEPELPKSARGRGKLWSDTVFQAVLALKKQLRSPDARLAMAAATAIIDLEQTRMRHSSTLAGSEEVSDAQLEFEDEQRGGKLRPRRNPRAIRHSPAMPAPPGRLWNEPVAR